MSSKPTCIVTDCDRLNDARGYCPPHYNRWKRYGDPLASAPKRVRLCGVDGCDRIHQSNGYCNLHAQRLYKHGDPTKVIDVSRKECKVDDCETLSRSHGYCVKHLRRFQSHGNPLVKLSGGRPVTGEHPSWSAAHKRVHRDKGTASAYPCIDCGGVAHEWSYNNLAPDELIDVRFRIRYALESRYYEPRCVKCHRRFDALARRERQASDV